MILYRYQKDIININGVDNLNKITVTTLRLPNSLLSNLKQIAKSQGLTLNALLLQILWQWLERKEKVNE